MKLIKEGVSPRHEDLLKQNAFFYLSSNPSTGIESTKSLMRLFLEYGVNINQQNLDGNTFLVKTSVWMFWLWENKTESFDFLNFLKDAGFDFSLKNKKGQDIKDVWCEAKYGRESVENLINWVDSHNQKTELTQSLPSVNKKSSPKTHL